MGTTWSVAVQDHVTDPETLNTEIQTVLDRIDGLMSNWKDDSDICRFNNLDSNTSLLISQETAKVIQCAKEIYGITEGRFDPTLSPLIELWGFSRKERSAFPLPEEITLALNQLGMDGVIIDGQVLKKETNGLSLNLSGIAKGYGVDAVYEMLVASGYKRFLVEVGGEVRVSGQKTADTPWRIGIETPRYASTITRDLVAIAKLSDCAMATSGDYRNFFEFEGNNYSHIIDPRTGYPVKSPIASVSVIASTCMEADALATAFMILSPEKCISLCDKDDRLFCLIIERDSGKTHYSNGMKELLLEIE